MSNSQQRNPKTQRQAEQARTLGQSVFNGQLRGEPLSDIGLANTFRSINIDNHGNRWQGRVGTDLYSSSKPAGVTYAKYDHIQAGVLIWLIGATVYVSNKAMTTFTTVLDLSQTTIAAGNAHIEPDDEQAILTTNSGIFRIVLNDTNGYYMYPVNTARPLDVLANIASTDSLVYGYNYLVAYSRINSGARWYVDGTGALYNRTTPDAILELETGTAKELTAENFYSELYFAEPAGDANHILTSLAPLAGSEHFTHYSIYRSKNIGPKSNGKVNNPTYFVWVDDAPVVNVFRATTDAAGVLTTTIGYLREMDWGSVQVRDEDANLYDIAQVGTDYVLYDTGTTTPPAAGTYSLSIGAGNTMICRQTGTTITRISGARIFTAADVGTTTWWANGAISRIIAYVDANTVTAQWTAANISQPIGINVTTRVYNDLVKDDGVEVGEVGLKERVLSTDDIYIPLLGFDGLPNADIGLRSESWYISATRDETKYYYSGIGAKKYALGQYKPDKQWESAKRPIRDIISFPNLAAFLLIDGTFTAALNTSRELGNTAVGESIRQIQPLAEVDASIGVYHWKSVAKQNANKITALTHEPAIRDFNGYAWSERNFAVTPDGKSAVQKYIESIDPNYDVMATYNMKTGYVLWLWAWVSATSTEVSDDVIIDTPGSAITGDDIWVDNPGDAITGNNVVVDNPGII